jgi:rubrerythrin
MLILVVKKNTQNPEILMTDEEYTPRNREKSKQAKYGWFWCNSCDRQLVRDGVKCPVCGTKNNPKKIRYE